MKQNLKFYIVTGMSGAGKSYTIKYLEDMGFFCVDNLPIELLTKFVELFIQSKGNIKKIAVVLDVRANNFESKILSVLNELELLNIDYHIIYLDASDKSLICRFNETRRTHPLSKTGNISKGIKLERKMLNEIKGLSNFIIDTTNLTLQDFRLNITKILGENIDSYKMNLNFISFGFKNGIPNQVDLLFDVRFLPNPYYIKTLEKKTGLDLEVQKYLSKWTVTNNYLQKIRDLLFFLIPNYMKEGKKYLTIAFGCTGGHHRSVFITEAIKKDLLEKEFNINIYVNHRDLKIK